MASSPPSEQGWGGRGDGGRAWTHTPELEQTGLQEDNARPAPGVQNQDITLISGRDGLQGGKSSKGHGRAPWGAEQVWSAGKLVYRQDWEIQEINSWCPVSIGKGKFNNSGSHALHTYMCCRCYLISSSPKPLGLVLSFLPFQDKEIKAKEVVKVSRRVKGRLWIHSQICWFQSSHSCPSTLGGEIGVQGEPLLPRVLRTEWKFPEPAGSGESHSFLRINSALGDNAGAQRRNLGKAGERSWSLDRD